MPARGCFETMRCDSLKVFALDAHLARLRKGCATLGMAPPSRMLLKNLLAAAIGKKYFKTARLRLSVSKAKRGVKIAIVVKKLGVSKNVNKGFSVVLAQEKIRGPGPAAGVKSLSRCFHERLFKKAKKLKCDEAVFCNSRGDVVEGTRTNIFIVAKGAVMTPSLDSGCLPGITRKIVIRCLQKMKMPFRARRVVPADLIDADEVFLTNAVIGVVPVVRLNKKGIGRGTAGSVTKKIAAVYNKEVEKKCRLVYNRTT